MQKKSKKYHILKMNKVVCLEVEARYNSGRYGHARVVIKDGRVSINQSDVPLNPTIDLDKLKELIAEYDALCPSAPA